MTSQFRIAHISDIHFGRIAHEDIVDALVSEIRDAGVDLVAVSGDLTQRARIREFEAARSMLSRLESTQIVVPGNHDVFAWWFPMSRLRDPLRRYKDFVTPDLLPTHEAPGIAVLGLNSAHGRTVKGGYIRREQREYLHEFFSGQTDRTFRVIVVHHHLTKIQALGPHDVARKARATLNLVADHNVDLVLCGHLHISHIEPVEIVPGDHRMVVASAGTATSSRGRKSNRDCNFYNVIEVNDASFSIEERRFNPDSLAYERECVTTFDRYD
jgi:3',5'-cyclic AMP phosphodiesterase CpdA